jgi:CRP-like cAMP-binding protein
MIRIMRIGVADHFLIKGLDDPSRPLVPIPLAAGDHAFRQGDPVHSVFIVARGRMLLNRCLADGSIATLYSAHANQSFAEASLSSEHYHCDAVAATDSVVVALPVAQLRRHFLADAASAMELAMFFARQVRDVRARLELRNVRSATARVFDWLRTNAVNGSQAVALSGTWSELADELGLSRETSYRALARLEREGSIQRDKTLVILRP